MADGLAALLGGAVDPYQEALRKAQANTEAIAARRKWEQGFEPGLADVFTQVPIGLRPEEMSTPPAESWRDVAGRKAGEGISALTGKNLHEAGRDMQTGLALSDFLPIVGDIQGYGDVYDDAKSGDWTSAALDLAAAILPGVPSVAGRIKRKAKSGEAVRAVEEALGHTPDQGAGLPPASEGPPPVKAIEDDYIPESAAPALAEATQPSTPKQGIKAYHGSPHSFDRFSMDKIGTGEGAQAYGHGLYFAENEGVARGYRDRLKQGTAVSLTDGGNLPQETIDFVRGYGDVDAARAGLQEQIDQFDNGTAPKIIVDAWRGNDAGLRAYVDRLRASARFIDENKDRIRAVTDEGHMYEVSINADPEDFLDWDKPLKEQPNIQAKLGWTPEKVAEYRRLMSAHDDGLLAALTDDGLLTMPPDARDAYEKARGLVREIGFSPDQTGADIARGSSVFDSAADVRKAGHLKDRGIPGIKYLDAGSRAPKTLFDGKPIGNDNLAAQVAAESLDLHGSPEAAIKALSENPGYRGSNAEAAELLRSGRVSRSVPDGSRNYVVFDDKLISIVKKYGLAAAISAGIISEEMGRQMQEQGAI